MIRRAGRWLIVLALGGCRALPELTSGECGNRVVEAGEDCDFFALRGSECRPPDAIGACHFDCSADARGERRACPTGFGCDESSVCRRALDAFELAPNPVPGGYRALRTGDFDGDGRADIVGLDMRGGRSGLTDVDIHYYDANGQLSASFAFSEEVFAPALFTQPGADAREGLVVVRSGFGVVLGERDRTLSPDVRPTYFLPQGPMTVKVVADFNIENTTPLVVLADRDGGLDLSVPSTGDDLLRKLETLPYTLEGLTPLVQGALFAGDEHPCDELVLAPYGADTVSAYQVCERDSEGLATYRTRALVTPLKLPDGALVDSGPLIVDLDGDSHEDLLISTDHGLFVAAGDGESLAKPTPFEFSEYDIIKNVTELRDQIEMPVRPLVAGDFTSDGIADLVTPEGLLVSMSMPRAAGPVFRAVHRSDGATWSEARIADVTGDGRPDVITASTEQADVDVFTGTGTDRPNALVIPTTHPAELLTIGDYDSDQVSDIAFIERGAGPSSDDAFLVAFGGSFQSLSQPLAGGHVARIWDLSEFPDSPDDLRSDIGILHALTTEDGSMGSALSMVLSTTQRAFVSPVQLEFVTEQGQVQSAAPRLVATGHFSDPDRTDALSLGYRGNELGSIVQSEPELWALPNLGSPTSTVVRLGWGLDPRLVPVDFDADSSAGTALASLVTGDVTGDGLDEVFLAAPIEHGARCLIASAELDLAALRLEPSPALVLDEPCVAAPVLALADLDADGAKDLVLATGSADVEGRIVVLWNDGHGGFDPSAPMLLVPSEARARDFTIYRSQPYAAPRIAYVTDHSVQVLESRGRDRAFIAVTEVPEMKSPTSIAAGDVTNDGLVDLVVADDGWIRLLKAAVVP